MKIRLLLLCTAVLTTLHSKADDFLVTSPDGHLKATVSLNDGKLGGRCGARALNGPTRTLSSPV